MKKILYFVIILSFTACTSEKAETVQNYTPTPNGVAGLQKANIPPSTNTNTGNLLVNPEHGQPGHDCNIAVGAPLKKSNKNNANDSTRPIVNPTTEAGKVLIPASPQPIAEGKKGIKLNPAHGEPNHNCDIAVGAPLT